MRLREPADLDTAGSPSTSRVAYAAAHVVANGERDPVIDWDATLALRHRIWDLGLGVAESMDTSQRGMGLSPSQAMDLGRRTVEVARERGGAVLVGVGTDALPPGTARAGDIAEAYLAQIAEVEGCHVVLMASRQLAASASHPEEYLQVYDSVLSRVTQPVVLHWLGDMFDPELSGYWGAKDPAGAVGTIVDFIDHHRDRISGIKVSVLDPAIEVELRSRLPHAVKTFTGDDYNYVDLIAGDESGHSHALLGAFAAIAPYASAALKRLDRGDVAGFRKILGPTETLSRLVFAAPTQFYKVGIAWLAYLNGLQDSFTMLAGFERNRPLAHLGELVVEADKLGYFQNPDLTTSRARAYFERNGVG